MKLRHYAVATLLALTLTASGAHAAAPPLDAAGRAGIITALARQLDDFYVYPDVATAMSQSLRAKQQAGGYDSLDNGKALADALTADLRAVSHDKHLRVGTGDNPRPMTPPSAEPTPEQEAAMLKHLTAMNFGIAKVEIMAGNIGYIDLRGFAPGKLSSPAITAAMTQVAGSDALILDMRSNGGGDPASVAWLSSYLFDSRTHLNDLVWREGNKTEEFWTDSTVPGKRFGQKKPVYVLTGPRTFSGGEEFSYDMQQTKRGTLVGETTGGGANPGRVRMLSPYFGAFIPNGRAVNPISKTSWEGTGVIPEVKVPVDDALATAHKLAMAALAK
jgi:hypothetical protein